MMNKPNILLIMTDQHRFDCLGCYGNSVIETPNLDQLASEGTLFENAYTPSPSCIPARACLLTGMDPWNTGILGMGRGQSGKFSGFKHTLPGELAKAGYHTQGVGKMHFSPQRSLNGFHNVVLDESTRKESPAFLSDYEKWFGENKTGAYEMADQNISWNSWIARPYHAPEFLHPTAWTVNESIDFLKRRDPEKPFFLKTSFARPHSPYDALPYYFDLYMNKNDIPEPAVGDWASVHDVPLDACDVDAWHGVRKPHEIKRVRASYYGSVNHIDHNLNRLFTYLRSNRLWDNTVVIFTTDHGDMLGDHNLWRKTYAYEGSAHIPFIIKMHKDFDKTAKLIDAPILLQDVMPTVLEAAKIPIPETVDGKSLLGLMKGDNTLRREFVHGEHTTCYSEDAEMQYLTDGKIKYIWFPRTGKEQLFDLEHDPYELNDLNKNSGNSEILIKWRERMIDVLEKRELGLTDGRNLVCQAGKPFIVSPNWNVRY